MESQSIMQPSIANTHSQNCESIINLKDCAQNIDKPTMITEIGKAVLQIVSPEHGLGGIMSYRASIAMNISTQDRVLFVNRYPIIDLDGVHMTIPVPLQDVHLERYGDIQKGAVHIKIVILNQVLKARVVDGNGTGVVDKALQVDVRANCDLPISAFPMGTYFWITIDEHAIKSRLGRALYQSITEQIKNQPISKPVNSTTADKLVERFSKLVHTIEQRRVVKQAIKRTIRLDSDKDLLVFDTNETDQHTSPATSSPNPTTPDTAPTTPLIDLLDDDCPFFDDITMAEPADTAPTTPSFQLSEDDLLFLEDRGADNTAKPSPIEPVELLGDEPLTTMTTPFAASDEVHRGRGHRGHRGRRGRGKKNKGQDKNPTDQSIPKHNNGNHDAKTGASSDATKLDVMQQRYRVSKDPTWAKKVEETRWRSLEGHQFRPSTRYNPATTVGKESEPANQTKTPSPKPGKAAWNKFSADSAKKEPAPSTPEAKKETVGSVGSSPAKKKLARGGALFEMKDLW